MSMLRKKLKKVDWSGYVFLFPALLILTLFLIFPIMWAFIASFKEIKPLEMKYSGLFNIPGEFVGISQYIEVFQNDLFIKSLFNTGYFAIIYIPITLISAAWLAILLNRKMKGVNFFRTVLFIPYIISIVSASLIFLYIFNSEQGMVNAMLHKFGGLNGPNWLSNSLLAMPVIAIMSSWKMIGYFMIIYLAGLQNIPYSLYEAADMDGANSFQKFWHVTWPLLGRITLVVSVLLMIDVLKVFQEVFVMTGGGPGDSTTTVPFLIFNEAFKYYRIGTASAMSYILFFIVIIITVIQKRSVDKRLG
ncbi:carbohydrate ABC transporter permease [Fictibacillus terranigra]|uniref:Sugar ABC transporter permease n=1 Tax=Fictibacillus terranigra TaxID=3058424 RepID=A0ABT8EDG8_9BACL|nr:sugar ABC transporter permease [Fictibacillus sp. CENA-BCM004]MDN4075984.1 sugar ABC transporter permease [Fictibacillus sp. CENA-BCM004]